MRIAEPSPLGLTFGAATIRAMEHPSLVITAEKGRDGLNVLGPFLCHRRPPSSALPIGIDATSALRLEPFHSRPTANETSYDRFFFFLGTLAPFLRASESPIAIACFLLVTFFFPLPLCSVPFFFLCIALFTERWAFSPYLAIFFSLSKWNKSCDLSAIMVPESRKAILAPYTY